MKYRLRQHPDPVLIKIAKKVAVFDSSLTDIVNIMFKIMKDENGCGLAAPQVGLSKRIVVIDCGEPFYMINPEIIQTRGEQESIEGCLSLKGCEPVTLIRPNYIKVKYQDVRGKYSIIEAEGDLLSRCLSHELSHLEGRTLIEEQELNKIKST